MKPRVSPVLYVAKTIDVDFWRAWVDGGAPGAEAFKSSLQRPEHPVLNARKHPNFRSQSSFLRRQPAFFLLESSALSDSEKVTLLPLPHGK